MASYSHGVYATCLTSSEKISDDQHSERQEGKKGTAPSISRPCTASDCRRYSRCRWNQLPLITCPSRRADAVPIRTTRTAILALEVGRATRPRVTSRSPSPGNAEQQHEQPPLNTIHVFLVSGADECCGPTVWEGRERMRSSSKRVLPRPHAPRSRGEA